MTDSGYLVETKTGRKGRTYHAKGMINEKLPVYLATEFNGEIPTKYSDAAILCAPENLKTIGFIN